MRLELRNVKLHQDMSEETNCFSATLYVNGIKAADVRNDGQGGCNHYFFKDRTLEKRVQAYAAQQLPGVEYEQLDILVHQMLEHHVALQQIKRWTKKSTVFRLHGDKPGQWRTLKNPYTTIVRDHLLKKYGTEIECIANEDLEKATTLSLPTNAT